MVSIEISSGQVKAEGGPVYRQCWALWGLDPVTCSLDLITEQSMIFASVLHYLEEVCTKVYVRSNAINGISVSTKYIRIVCSRYMANWHSSLDHKLLLGRRAISWGRVV